MAIARVALPVAAAALFDYWIPDGLAVTRGALVRVRLARRALTGVVVDVVADVRGSAREACNPSWSFGSDVPALPADLLALAEFVATYYQEPLGLVSRADAAAARGGCAPSSTLASETPRRRR